jgi:nitronate monooxygenase
LDSFLRKLGIALPVIQAPRAGVSTPELADAGYRAALLGPAAEHTVMTAAISGRPARCLVNRFAALAEGIEPEAIPDYPIAYGAGKALHGAAKAAGKFGYGAQWAGQGAPLAGVLPAAERVARLRSEMERALAKRLTG